MSWRAYKGCFTKSPSSQQCSKVGNYCCLHSTGGKSKVQCLICPKLLRIPGARRELRSLLTLIAVSQENKMLLSFDVLYCVWGGWGSCKICVFIRRGEKLNLGLPSLPMSEQGLMFLNKKPNKTKGKIVSSNFVLLFWSGLNCFYVFFFLNYSYYSYYDYSSFFIDFNFFHLWNMHEPTMWL